MSEPQKRRTRRAKPGDLNALKRELWHAVLTAADLLDSGSDETRLRAVHATSQAAAVYRSIYETADLERRFEALEARIAGVDNES
jgi:hypothetical protein